VPVHVVRHRHALEARGSSAPGPDSCGSVPSAACGCRRRSRGPGRFGGPTCGRPTSVTVREDDRVLRPIAERVPQATR
jgi:hypothetical protein